ncbi:lipopolysaccharide biosynthesis protein [Couchioplanes caeruleus]|uniref:O-antigen/teichoic acid export membrane protein n=1 Tax=Couchioplanes caeruleus TaxID=56438 RepID=A0A3N1GPL2_9ACTN|nr:oligosaccharide flippase family protein [Couchioplanes caeruleus]ROP32076.1 O-antigen/teichoic acid export membrane protein [Couchioplanes caeruleus]
MTAVLEKPPARHSTGAGWLMIATTSAGVINYGYALVLTHGLTPAEYAAFAAAQALLMVRAAISAAGIPWILARELAKAPGDRARQAAVTTFAFWTNLVIGLVLTAVVAGGVLLFGTARDAVVVACASLCMSVGSTGMGYLQGVGRMDAIAVLFTTEVVVKAVVGIGLVFWTDLGPTGALAGFVAGSLVLLLPLPRFQRLLGPPVWRAGESALLRAAIRQTRMQANVAVASAGDTVLVAALGLGGAGGGPYQAASALGRVPLFASNAVSTAVFPQLSRDSCAERKAGALRSYLLVALLMTGVLVTLPGEIRSALFPDEFATIGQWLPYAAVLGLAIGAVNLSVTFLQADDSRGTGAHLTLVTAGYLALVTVAGAVFGVAGLAVGAAVAGVLAVAALALLAPVRPGWRILLRSRRSLHDLAGIVVVFGALAVAGHPLLWTAIAAGAGLLVLAASFPEFMPRRRT